MKDAGGIHIYHPVPILKLLFINSGGASVSAATRDPGRIYQDVETSISVDTPFDDSLLFRLVVRVEVGV